MELARVTHTGLNISSDIEVFTYTYPGTTPREIIIRVDLGDDDGPLSGVGGQYLLRCHLDGALVVPASAANAPNGKNKVILVSRPIAIDAGDLVSVHVQGLAGDVSVNTVVSARDVTPATISDIAGPGYIEVDHNYGGEDVLSYQTVSNAAIADAEIQIFTKADWDAERRATVYVVATARTTSDRGRWARSVMLNPGDYVLRYFKPQAYGPDIHELTVA